LGFPVLRKKNPPKKSNLEKWLFFGEMRIRRTGLSVNWSFILSKFGEMGLRVMGRGIGLGLGG